MNKLKLIVCFLSVLFLLESCKKDTYIETTLTNAVLQADINSTGWIPKDTLSAVVTYTAATKTKVLTINGTVNTAQVYVAATAHNTPSTAGYPLITLTVDTSSNLSMIYSAQQLNSSGSYVFVTTGTVKPGSGTITISAVDSVKKLISGTFSFTQVQDNYDTSGNLVSVTVNEVLAGQINNMPYIFTSK